MAALLAFADAVDIGGGRGRLAAPAAASLARVDAAMRSAFGRAADINEAWRSPAVADDNYRKYQAYLNGGPWAPLAFAAKDSIHCRGYAVDTDDTSPAQMRIWNDHGWFWTVYRNGVLVERWHLEYDASRDNHRNDPAPTGVGGALFDPTSEEDEMPIIYKSGGAHMILAGSSFMEVGGELTRKTGVDGQMTLDAFSAAGARTVVLDRGAYDRVRINIIAGLPATGTNLDAVRETIRATLKDAAVDADVDEATITKIAMRVMDEQDRRARERLTS